MPYAILRFEKRKGGPATAIEKHHERKKTRYASNPDVDPERSHLNYHLIQPRLKYYGEIQTRIEKAQKKNPKMKLRKDSVKFIDTIITATPEFLEGLSEERRRFYFEHALEFLKREVGEENIFSAVVHMDEHNPHMHVCFVPLTRDHRLCAKEVMGGRDKLVEWQDKFHDHMAAEFPELERGQAAAATKRRHIPTWLYKQAHRLTDEMTGIRAEIESIGTFNANRQKEKVLQRLLEWYPQINALEAKLRPYDEQLKILRDNDAIYRREHERIQWELELEGRENQSLSYELQEYQEFIDSIPPELLAELRRRFEQQQQPGEEEMQRME